MFGFCTLCVYACKMLGIMCCAWNYASIFHTFFSPYLCVCISEVSRIHVFLASRFKCAYMREWYSISIFTCMRPYIRWCLCVLYKDTHIYTSIQHKTKSHGMRNWILWRVFVHSVRMCVYIYTHIHTHMHTHTYIHIISHTAHRCIRDQNAVCKYCFQYSELQSGVQGRKHSPR